MPCIARLPLVLFVLACTGAVAACSSKVGPSNIPTLFSETFTGTLNPLSSSSHEFRVRYEVGYTSGTIALLSLRRVSNDQPVSISVGVAFGNTPGAGGTCTRTTGYASPVTFVNQYVPTTDAPFAPGLFCVQIYDNPDAPTVPEPLTYTLLVEHY